VKVATPSGTRAGRLVDLDLQAGLSLDPSEEPDDATGVVFRVPIEAVTAIES
jgi:hypothetical protein